MEAEMALLLEQQAKKIAELKARISRQEKYHDELLGLIRTLTREKAELQKLLRYSVWMSDLAGTALRTAEDSSVVDSTPAKQPEGMTKLDKALKNIATAKRIITENSCPSEFGLKDCECDDSCCEDCWNQEVEQKMTVRTGGKWQLQRTPYESEIDIVSDGRTIATVEAGEGQEKVAQMIVSAPDMLEALEDVKNILDTYDPLSPLCSLYIVWSSVDAAIRKARGDLK